MTTPRPEPEIHIHAPGLVGDPADLARALADAARRHPSSRELPPADQSWLQVESSRGPRTLLPVGDPPRRSTRPRTLASRVPWEYLIGVATGIPLGALAIAVWWAW